MKRPSQHTMEDVSLRIFSESIPREWINKQIIPDYALDREIEIVENENLTGAVFYAQLKGVGHPQVIDEHISLSLEVKHLRYYSQKDVPVILVAVDIGKEKCYWVFLQEYIYEILDTEKPSWTAQKTVTVRIPLKNEVTSATMQLKSIAKGGPTYLIARKIDRIPNEYLSYWEQNAEAITRLSEVAGKLGKKQLQLKFEVSYRYEKENDRGNAYRTLLDIYKIALASGDKDICIRSSLAMTFHMNPFYESEKVIKLLKEVRKMIDESGNTGYDILWRAIFFETIFAEHIKRYNEVRMLHLVASQHPEGIMAPFLDLEIQKIISEIFSSMLEIVTCTERAYEAGEYLIFVDSLQRMAKMQYMWCYNNSLGGNAKIIYDSLKHVELILTFTRNLANRLSSDYEFSLLLDLARLYGSLEETDLCNESLDEAMAIAEKLEHKGYQLAVEDVRKSLEKNPTKFLFS